MPPPDLLRTPAQRLRYAREMAGYTSPTAFSAAHGIPQPTYHQHESGTRKLRPDVAEKYAEELGCSVAWLLTGEGPLPIDQTVGIISRPFRIAELDIRASAGGGALNEFEGSEVDAVDHWQVPADFIRAQTTAPPEKLRVIRVYGDSMQPVFNAGDRVLVDTSDRTPSPPGIFVLWDGLGTVVKRVEHIPYSAPASVKLLSANPAYGSYEKTLDEVQIAGRVIAKWLWT